MVLFIKERMFRNWIKRELVRHSQDKLLEQLEKAVGHNVDVELINGEHRTGLLSMVTDEKQCMVNNGFISLTKIKTFTRL